MCVSVRDCSNREEVGEQSRRLWFHIDVCVTVEVDRLMSEMCTAFSRFDVLINNAGGFAKRSPSIDASDDYIDAVFRLNARWVGPAAFDGGVRYN